MANYAEYFERIGYKPKYFIGDRVFGYYQKIPFIGTVGNDSLVSLEEGPKISIFLDLPMKTTEGVRKLIIVKHKDVKQILKDYDDSGISGTAKKNRK